jgi:hypothetical protein
LTNELYYIIIYYINIEELTMKQTIKIMILKKYNDDPACPSSKSFGWIIKASNGDLPEEGFSHATKKEAINALYKLYSDPVWNLRIGGGFWIDV